MPESTDPFANVDAAANITLLEQRLESRVELPYYRAALEAALGLVAGRPERIVDLGCGTGATTRWLAERLGPTCQLTGVDLSTRLIASAGALAAQAGLADRTSFVTADAAQTNLPAASFDLVFAATLLEHTPAPAAIVAEMARLVRPGGEVVIVVQDYETLILNNPGQDRRLTRRLLNAFTDGFAHPWAGRATGGWLMDAGLGQLRVTAAGGVETSAPPAFLEFLNHMMRTLTAGEIEPDQLEAWLEGLRHTNERGAFFANWQFFCWHAS